MTRSERMLALVSRAMTHEEIAEVRTVGYADNMEMGASDPVEKRLDMTNVLLKQILLQLRPPITTIEVSKGSAKA